MNIGDVPSGEGFWSAGKQFFRWNPNGFQGKIAPSSGQNACRLGMLTFFKQALIPSAIHSTETGCQRRSGRSEIVRAPAPRNILKVKGGEKSLKESYTISELAKLFNLNPDTLRYYEERGILHPIRSENRYRMYGIQDICTLNVVRALRELGMPLEEIRDYLEGRTVTGTLELLDREDELLRSRMADLKKLRREAMERRKRLVRYSAVQAGQMEILEEQARPYVYLRENVILEGEIDFLLKKLEKDHQEEIKILGSACMGAALDGVSLAAGVYNHYASVFFLTAPGHRYDAVLPAGRYARWYYRGAYTGFEENYKALLAALGRQGLLPTSPPLELYRIDAHDTSLEAEYLTEIQVQVKEQLS